MIHIRQTNRAFGLMFGTALILVACAALFLFDAMITWLLGVGGVFVIIALLMPAIILPLNRLWGGFAYQLGRINNFLLLGLFYYLFIVPFGLIFKLFRRDLMQRRTDTKMASYWQPVGRQAAKDNYPDMF